MKSLKTRITALECEDGGFLTYEECLRRLANPHAMPGRVHDPKWIAGLARLAAQ